MANRYYCSNVAEELEGWSEKLHKLSSEIDSLPTGSKQRLFSQIEELHIIMSELDERLCGMLEACSTVEEMGEVEKVEGEGVDSYGEELSGRGNERFDYEIGG
jgi:hypothetical protein